MSLFSATVPVIVGYFVCATVIVVVDFRNSCMIIFKRVGFLLQ